MPRYALKSLPSLLSLFIMSSMGKTGRYWNSSTWKLSVQPAKCADVVRRRNKGHKFSRLCVLATLFSFVGLAGGQVAPGFPSFAPQDCHGVDCVDLLNNNVSLNIPVMSKAGAINFNLSLNGSYYISLNSATTTWQPSQLLAIQFAPLTQASSYLGLDTSGWTSGTFGLCPDGVTQTTEYFGLYIIVGGTYHYLPAADFTDTTGCYHRSITDTVNDNSGYTATFYLHSASAVYDRAGDSIGVGSITDSNSNSITFVSPTYTDSLGLTALTTGSGNFPNYTWTDVNGGSPHVSFTTSSTVHLKSAFGCSGVNDFDVTNQTLPSAVNFPDGTSLGITYEGTPGHTGDYTGRLNQITLREGGTVAYTYGGSNNGLNCSYQTVPSLTRKLGNGDTTTYTLSYSLISGSNYKATNTVVDPGGNRTIYTLTGLTSTGNSSSYAQMVTEVQRYQGTSTLLTTDTYCYNTAFASCSTSSAPTAQVTPPIFKLIVFHQINGMSNWSAQETHFDHYGNVTYSAAYDFGGTSPVRATTITYGSCSASCNTSSPTISSIGSNINNKAGEVVTTQNGSTVAQTNYTYDTHGKLLSTSLWNGSAFIGQTTANTYNSNGTIATSYDLANNETTYAYSSSGYTGCGSCTQYPFPTSIKNIGTGLTVSATYNGVGGVKLTDVDANGNTVATYCYNTGTSCSGGTADPYWRALQVTDPYGATVVRTYPTGSSPDTSSSSFEFNSSNSINATTVTTDGWGRPVNSQTKQSPSGSNYDTVSTAYGWSSNYGQVVTSQPCSTTSGSSCTGVHTFDYDPLGRLHTETTTSNETVTNTYSENDLLSVLTPSPSPENSKQTQTEYDGLGRVSKVCHIGSTASTGSGAACNQNTGSANGATDAYTYTQGTGYTETAVVRGGSGGQQRTTYFDALGRVYETITPEGGTWRYYFDTYSSCPTNYKGAVGQLSAIADPDGNLICYAYDSLNRISGVNANGTTCRHFFYDTTYGTLPSGVSTPTNTLGRIAEASTDNCSGSLITDEWFSYDKDGRELNQWQSTPHSTQYYQSTATFYANGAVNTVQLASPSFYTMTWGLDGEGRWNTLANTTASQNIVTGATFYPAYNPATISLTGATPDTDAYTFDPNTGKVTQVVFTVGATPVTETLALSWNANRTLGQVQITDNFNTGGSMTCYSNSSGSLGYGYDDWARLNEFDCGSGNWGQQYAYDIYDNLTKTVLSGRTGTTWNPGYPSLNQCSGCSFDANGNTTSDGSGSNHWTWNEFSKMKSWASSGTPTCGTSGKCITYDAFGRMVEYSSGTTWKEVFYTQAGTVNMSGTTINYAQWAAPEGGTGLVVGTNGEYYLHKDWLGNARLVTTVPGRSVYADRAFTPYGEIFNSYGTSNARHDIFAGMTDVFNQGVQWDTPNRELSVVGRWLSPDPAGAGWNRYAYVTNPNSETDPLGLAGGGCGGEAGRCGPRNLLGVCTDSFGASGPCNAMTGSSGCNATIDGGGMVPCQLAFGSALSTNSGNFYMKGSMIFGSSGIHWNPPTGPPDDRTPGYWSDASDDDGDALGSNNTGPANNGNNCQAPFLCNPVRNIPVLQQPPSPPQPHGNYGQYLLCVGGGYLQGLGDPDNVLATIVVNAAPAVFVTTGQPGKALVGLGAAALFDLSKALALRQQCTAATYGGTAPVGGPGGG
jgi:RHS repeat-associated protein